MLKNKSNQLVLAGLFTALTAVGAFIKVPFPLVPLTLQSFFTVLAGVILFPQYALLSQVTYLVLGLAGLPVFANGGGLGYLFQPTFGYLLSLPLAAFVVSFLLKKSPKTKSVIKIFIASLTGLLLILFLGSVWLYFSLKFTVGSGVAFFPTVKTGALVFLPGTLVKAILVTFIAHYLDKRL